MSNIKKTLFYLDLVSYLIIFRIKNLNQNMGVILTEKRVFLIFDISKNRMQQTAFSVLKTCIPKKTTKLSDSGVIWIVSKN